tara:strand:- start:3727 stop:4560 length:834 start_codon:yes stop_codon:yes gene_type:complete
MRTALCLHGYFGTLSENNFSSAHTGYEHIRETILSKTDSVDVFVHCWQPEHLDDIKNMYDPKCMHTENQIDFDAICKENKISQDYIDEGFPREKTMYRNATAARILSFYYSRCQSLELCRKYEQKNDFKYDWVVTTRFDISHRGGKEVNQIRFNTEDDNNFLYTTYWNQMNCGYGDMWFYGSSDIMQRYGSIYRNAIEDFRPYSDYQKSLTTGWSDSKRFNVFSATAPEQFSNEIMKDKIDRTKDRMLYPLWMTTNSHLHHKWFSIQSGLYNITRWV